MAAGADGSFRLDEEATDNVWCSTTFAYKWGDEAVLTITPEKTKKEGMPAERAYELVFTGTAQGMTAQKRKQTAHMRRLRLLMTATSSAQQ